MPTRKLVFLWVVLVVSFLYLSVAAAGFSYHLDQTKVRLDVPAGSSKAGAIKVTNSSDSPISLKVYFEDWVYASAQDGSKNFFPSQSTALSCSQWFKFSPQEFTLPAFGTQNLNYTLKVPPEAKGGYYAVMFFESAAVPLEEAAGQTKEVRSGIGLSFRMGTLFYVDVRGTVKRQAELSNFTFVRAGKDGYNLTCDFKNTGNADITCAGTYYLMDKAGLIYARGEFNEIYTFPQDAAKLKAAWKEAIPQGSYDLVLTLNLGKGLEEKNFGRGPVLTKETKLSIGADGEVLSVGELE